MPRSHDSRVGPVRAAQFPPGARHFVPLPPPPLTCGAGPVHFRNGGGEAPQARKAGESGMRIFGIDPGSSKLGIGVVDAQGSRFRLVDHEVIRAGAKLPFATRLLKIHKRLRETLERHQPQVVAIEEVFFGRNARTAIKIGECRGVALLAAAESGAEIAEYAARDVKKAVVGTGAAGKDQVKWMIARQFGLDPAELGEDAADALALCIAHAQRTAAHALGR